jgi:hypothetical protein
MVCNMPPVQLPTDFVSELNNTGGQINDTSGPGFAVYYGLNSKDRADIYVGLKLDGVSQYRNISQTSPTIKMQFYLQPTVFCKSKDIAFNPDKDNFISIKVSVVPFWCNPGV